MARNIIKIPFETYYYSLLKLNSFLCALFLYFCLTAFNSKVMKQKVIFPQAVFFSFHLLLAFCVSACNTYSYVVCNSVCRIILFQFWIPCRGNIDERKFGVRPTTGLLLFGNTACCWRK